jgi:hypothetical protein
MNEPEYVNKGVAREMQRVKKNNKRNSRRIWRAAVKKDK